MAVPDDTADTINAAKSAAEQANSTIAQVVDTLGPIKEQLQKWQDQYGDSNTTTDDINNALMEANKSSAFHLCVCVFVCVCEFLGNTIKWHLDCGLNGPHSRTFSEVSSEMFLTGFGKTT